MICCLAARVLPQSRSWQSPRAPPAPAATAPHCWPFGRSGGHVAIPCTNPRYNALMPRTWAQRSVIAAIPQASSWLHLMSTSDTTRPLPLSTLPLSTRGPPPFPGALPWPCRDLVPQNPLIQFEPASLSLALIVVCNPHLPPLRALTGAALPQNRAATTVRGLRFAEGANNTRGSLAAGGLLALSRRTGTMPWECRIAVSGVLSSARARSAQVAWCLPLCCHAHFLLARRLRSSLWRRGGRAGARVRRVSVYLLL